MKIALFGGAFNPPHIGHILIAKQILDFTDVDELWFVPNYGQNPPKHVASHEDRLAMIQCVDLAQTKVSTIEIDQKLDGNTINLLPHLPHNHSYVFIIGSDQVAGFHKWGRYQELLQTMPFIVFPRFGYPIAPLYENMTEVKHDLLITTDISSTKIRMRVNTGLSISHFVLPEVAKYIREKGLYT